MYNDGEGYFTVVADLFNEGSTANDGIPVVGRSPILPEGFYRQGSWSIAIDVDGDDDVDLQLTRSGDHTVGGEPVYTNRLLVNDGAGIFELYPGDSWPSTGCGLSPHQPDPDACLHDDQPSIQLALVYDLDRDGLDDMLLHSSIFVGENDQFDSVFLQVLISNGDGTFRDETAERYPGGPFDGLSDFQMHDLDGDGHKDLFSVVFSRVNNSEKTDIRINDGEGYFRPLKNDWIQSNWSWNVVLDVDGDGGTDFVEQGGGSYLGGRNFA
jgi:hypothetical protein